MAKKSVATLQTGSKRLTKAIKMVKSPTTGAYTFVEAVMAPEMVGEFFDTKKRYNLGNINTVNDDLIKKNIFSLGNSTDIACTYISKLMRQ